MLENEIYIATAPSRKAKQWHNKSVTWAWLVDKCRNSRDTGETLTEYTAMSRDEQSQRKDIGGFVGGYLKDGIRKKSKVDFRSVLTFDVDNAEQGFWEGYTMGYDYESFMYSTHTSTHEKPRYRLVILLSRTVNSEEYEAIGRAIASSIGIEQFDGSTFEAERLMYWPSHPTDQQPTFEYQEGRALNPDEILATYHDWHDVSEWARSKREANIIRRETKKQGDPTEKPGIVGAFCRQYSIQEAIEKYLPGVYVSAGENRYTYTNGTVAQGLVLYENGKFAYANNDTDPCSRHLVNAFDLVRLHLYGEEDDDTSQSIDKRKSFMSMRDLAMEDNNVRRLMVKERISSAASDFEEMPVETGDENWMDCLEVDKKGNIKNTANNAKLILLNAPEFKGSIANSDFDGRTYVLRKLPWREEGIWRDVDNKQLSVYLERYGITTKDKVVSAFGSAADDKHFHPVRDYLTGLTWDGTERLATLFVDFLGAPDTELIRMQTILQFKAAVARVLRPGVKFDQCLILTGPQGIGKSTILSKMAGDWFNESFTTFEGKDAMENLRGSWIIEIGELTALASAKSNETVKNFMSRTEDTYRAAYAQTADTHPRQCVFFGTTNDATFLTGNNGNRRFWIVPTRKDNNTKSVFRDLNNEYRDQVWAEAVHLYKADKTLILSEELNTQAEDAQEEYNVLSEDDRVFSIAEFLDRRLPQQWNDRSPEAKRAYFVSYDDISPDAVVRRDTITIAELAVEWAGLNIEKLTTFTSRQYGALLTRVPGWRKADSPKKFNGVLRKYWERIVEDKDTEDLL